MNNNEGKRITLKRTRPNALFEEWLEELHEDAKAKKSKLEPMIKEALESLLKYPLPLNSGAECIALKGFKKKLCEHLDQRLEVYNYNLKEKRDVLRKLRYSTILMCYNDVNGNGSRTLQSSSSENTQPAQSNGASNSGEHTISKADSTFKQLATSSNGTKEQAQSSVASNARESTVSPANPTPEQPLTSSNGTKNQSQSNAASKSREPAVSIANTMPELPVTSINNNKKQTQSNAALNLREPTVSIKNSTPEQPVTLNNGTKKQTQLNATSKLREPTVSNSTLEQPVTLNSGTEKQAQSNAASNLREPTVSIENSTLERPVTANNGTKKRRQDKKYMPAYKSGAYAILIALLEDSIEHPGNYLTKQELIDKAQKHSEESFVRPKPETFYTAWSNMSQLVTKSLVSKVRTKTVKYQLTDQGIELAKQVLAEYKKTPTANDVIFKAVDNTKSASSSNINVGRNNAPSTSSNIVECIEDTNDMNIEHNIVSKTVQVVIEKMPSTKIKAIQNNALATSSAQMNHSPSTSNSEDSLNSSQENNNNQLMNDKNPCSAQTIHLPAGSFDIILLIDKNETGGLSKKNDPTVAQFKKYPDLNHEYRSLKVGDFTWIARHKVHKDQELVLPFIVERKRMDDLAASIKDGRFHEQKFRLRKCSMKVVYLIENYGSNKNVGLPIQNLMQALANTRILDKFKIHVTDSLTHTARFLAMMTKRLTIRYMNRDLKGQNGEQKDQYLMTFAYFNKTSAKSKSLSVKATFIKLLLQIKGVSVEKALAITAVYNTPRSLIQAYRKCDRNTGEYLLAHLKYGDLGRKVGPAVSVAIYQVFATIWVPNNELN